MDTKINNSRVRSICGTSVDDAKIDIQNEKNAAVLFACIEHETQHSNRSSMLRNLRSRIRTVEKATGKKKVTDDK